ncbi:MAG: M67 family metallopeptidase [Deltaproteobacteria bacterium]|nr:M67 family metallopeptidase [Deltaproteobacteria bacterium]
MLQMAKSIYERIIGRAREGFPFEVCGILGGKGNIVSAIYPMTNTDASRDHFMMDPREQFSVVKALRSQELEMLAVYHSHPETPARLSDEDIRLALTPDISYVIVSLAEPSAPEVRSFRIADKKVGSEELRIIYD